MLTPQEVSEHSFNKASFGGYHMAMVDEFLDVLTDDYTALYQENATLKNKLKVLVEKVEEYRSTEEAMRKTLVTAQRMADEMVEEATQKQKKITQEAEFEAKKTMDALAFQIRQEEDKLTAIQNSAQNYVASLKALCQKELDYIDQATAQLGLRQEPVAQVAPVATPVMEDAIPIEEEIRANLYQVLQEEREKEARAKAVAVQELEDESQEDYETAKEEVPVRRSQFDNLQFGKDFEIS